MWCFWRMSRSSSTAATTRPSCTRQADESWNAALIPRITVMTGPPTATCFIVGVGGLPVAEATALRSRHEIEVEPVLCDEPEASPEAKETVYRIVQEALHNIVKHARASNVEIKMECGAQRINFEVRDDGVGFEAGRDFPGHLGLRSMRERASRLGGTLEVESAPGRGTRICARIPV